MTGTLYVRLSQYCSSLEEEFNSIPKTRQGDLLKLSHYLKQKWSQHIAPKIIVICTHNSRRSHLGQLWLATGAAYYGLGKIETYSGGTEATAFNPRAVAAAQRAGFQISTNDETVSNPQYQITWQDDMTPYVAFSTRFDTPPNPTENFGAIMVCTSADEACPYVPGADFRIALPFNDPKAYDGTDLESAKYDEACRLIGREMLFVLANAK